LQNAFQNHNYYKEIIRSYLNIIVLKIASLNSSRTGQQLTLNPKVKDFRNLIERSNEEQKDLAFYAEQINVTKRKLSNICKKELGRPATSLLNEQLIMKSK